MQYTIITNTPLIIDPSVAAIDQGWSISGNTAFHEGCYPGFMESSSILLTPGQWVVEYNISSYSSGLVRVIVAGLDGINRTAIGNYKEIFTVPENADNYIVKFYSEGTNAVNFTQIYPVLENENNGTTIAFDVKENKYTSNYSFVPEMMLRFTNDFFTFTNGQLWQHHKNDLRNNFYDVQYYSKIDLLCNVDSAKNKQYYNLRLDSTGRWYAPKLTTPKTYKFPKGMISRLKKNNFQQLDNKLWADILKDMNDPHFMEIENISERQLKALFNGRTMEGPWLNIELRCDDTDEATLASITVYYTETERSF